MHKYIIDVLTYNQTKCLSLYSKHCLLLLFTIIANSLMLLRSLILLNKFSQ